MFNPVLSGVEKWHEIRAERHAVIAISQHNGTAARAAAPIVPPCSRVHRGECNSLNGCLRIRMNDC